LLLSESISVADTLTVFVMLVTELGTLTVVTTVNVTLPPLTMSPRLQFARPTIKVQKPPLGMPDTDGIDVPAGRLSIRFTLVAVSGPLFFTGPCAQRVAVEHRVRRIGFDNRKVGLGRRSAGQCDWQIGKVPGAVGDANRSRSIQCWIR